MKTASQALINLLNSNTEILRADLLTFNLVSGQSLYYTNADIPLTINGCTYQCSLRWDRNRISHKAGVEVDNLELTIYPDDRDLVLGVPFLHALKNGVFDGATAQLETVLTDTWANANLYGTLVQFFGRVGDINPADRTEVTMEVNSYTELLSIQMPANLYETGCIYTVFESGCALNRANYATAGTVGAGSTRSAINANLSQADGYFTQGMIVFQSGPNAGATRTVKQHASGQLQLIYPLLSAPQPGDTFTVYPGCDGQATTCQGKYNNIVHFRGFPYIPAAETAF